MCLAVVFKSNVLLFTFANLESISHWAASIHFDHSPHFPLSGFIPDHCARWGYFRAHCNPYLPMTSVASFRSIWPCYCNSTFCRGNYIFVLTIFHRTPCDQLNMFKAVFGRNRKEEKRSRRDPGRKENKQHHLQHCTHYSLSQVTRHIFTDYNSVMWFCW